MAEEQSAQTQTDTSGIERTTDGTLVDQSSQTTNPPTDSTQTPQSTDGKTLLTEKGKETETKEPVKGAPEKYEDYKLPEGYTLDPEVKTNADAMFKELGLSQENAQRLVDFYVKQTNDAFQAPFDAYREMTDKWRTDSESHPDLKGRLGPGQEVNVRIAKFLDGMGDAKLASDFKELMDLTGAGNHSAFIRVIDYAARRLSEGSHVAGNGPSRDGQSRPNEAPPSAAAAMWPTLPSANNRGG